MEQTDRRQKLADLDYQRIRFAINVQNSTIREVANKWGVSTKYVHRLITAVAVTDAISTTVCSGCHYSYSWGAIQSHWATYTSGFTKPLSCGLVAP